MVPLPMSDRHPSGRRPLARLLKAGLIAALGQVVRWLALETRPDIAEVFLVTFGPLGWR